MPETTRRLQNPRFNYRATMRVNQAQEFIIGGYTRAPHTFDALIFGYYDGPRLLYAARTRNGFTPASREKLFRRLGELETGKCPFANLPETQSGRWGEGLTAAKMKNCVWVKPGSQPLDLAPAFLGAVQLEIERHRRAALSVLQEELAEQLDRAADLRQFADAVESERDAGRAQIEELTSQRDRLDGELRAVRGEVEMLRTQMERATGAVEDARIELARAQLQVENFQKRAGELEIENRQLLQRAAIAETRLEERAERPARKSQA